MTSTAPGPGVLVALERLLAGRGDVRRGHMFGATAFFTGPRMFACVLRDGVGLKLPEDRVRALADRVSVGPFVGSRGHPMRGWILLRHADPSALEEDRDLVLEALAFVAGSLPGAEVPGRDGRS